MNDTSPGSPLSPPAANNESPQQESVIPETLPVVITHLEMHSRPERPRQPAPALGRPMLIMRARQATPDFYRFLYNAVGSPWNWYERNLLSDGALTNIIHNPAVQVQVLYVDGVPAGYFELDARTEGEVELVYFGLMPSFIGLKLGPWFLDCAVFAAWDLRPRRIWVHTCSLDHPRALSLYQRSGFIPFAQERHEIPNPALLTRRNS